MGFFGSLAGGLLGAGSSVVQNSQNRQNVRETNQMNYKINQMNNQFNERMAIQQRNWQENMWNKENAYNTASAQRQRLEEAGLNPYLMMNEGSAGTAQSVGTGASAPSYRDWETDRKSTRLNSSHSAKSRMPSSA